MTDIHRQKTEAAWGAESHCVITGRKAWRLPWPKRGLFLPDDVDLIAGKAEAGDHKVTVCLPHRVK